jgi:hypothetical protein
VTFADNSNGTATLSGTPAAGTSGTYNLTFTAANGVGNDATQAFTLTVNEALGFTSANSATFTVGSAGSYTVSTTGFPTSSLTETGALPSGVTFVANSDGTATLSGTPTTGSGGAYNLTFAASNSVGSPATQAFTLTVNEAPAVTVSPTNQTVNAGQTATFTAAASGYPVPNVQWQVSTDGGHTFSLIPGATSTTYSFTATATQNGNQYDAVFSKGVGTPVTTNPATLTVKATAATMTTVTPSVSTSVFGQAVTFTATVKAVSPATGTPTGSVTFMDGSTTLGTVTLNASGKATLTTKGLPAGADTITAIYSGDSNFDTSTSSGLNQTVSQDGTTATIVSSANPSRFGQMLTMTITIKAAGPGGGVPTGTVTILDGSNPLDTVSLDSGGKATFSTRALGVGSHTITATYSGDTNFTSSTTAALNQTVSQAATKTTITSSASTSRFGQPVTFTATVKAVAPGSGVPTGTVTFYDGTTSLGTVPLYGSGQATISIGSLSVGTHSITASYTGDGNFTASTSTALTQTVNQAATKTTLVSSANPSNPGQVTFTATVAAVTPGIGTPTGTVTFSINGTAQTPVATLTVVNGVDEATFTTTLSAGTYTITAVYTGDVDFTTSTSAVFNQKVK